MKKYNVAIVGASGNVGREILNILDFRTFPFKEIYALASSKSEGQKIIYGNDKEAIIKDLEKFEFKNVDIRITAMSIMLNVESINWFTIFEPHGVKAREYIETITEFILSGLLKKI